MKILVEDTEKERAESGECWKVSMIKKSTKIEEKRPN